MRFGCFSSSFNEAVKRGVKRVDSRMGEMRALIEAVSGTVKADEQVGAWSLTAYLDPPGSAPDPAQTP